MHRGAARLFLFGFLLFLFGPPSGAQPEKSPPEESFGDEITVSLVPMVIRVVDTWGRPILGLKPEDFRVRVGKKDVPVAGLDWIAAGETEPPPSPSEPLEAEGVEIETAEAPLPGRLVVIFVQADLNPTRISGQLRLRPYTRELLGSLHPGDRVAVVSYDSHLKLWQDFTPDRGVVHAAVDEAMLFSGERQIAPGDPVSLASHLDPQAAREAASPERALEVMARALEPLPGEKMVIYLGWGLGRFGNGGVKMTPDYKPAVKALGAARASVFVLDVTSADYHSLEVGLEGVAEATGGLYLKTFRLPSLATDTLAQTISGYYVLSLDRASIGEEDGKVRIDLRQKKGTVLARSTALR
ncbi:MAG TPA: hypothetical protein VKK31_05020 [Thermoanaerobaculia bacterium]|nr:hypothetical protein [Thermoanaerobaculia bacterium]